MVGCTALGLGTPVHFLSASNTLESNQSEIGCEDWESTIRFLVSGVLLAVLENPRERIIFSAGRTQNRIR